MRHLIILLSIALLGNAGAAVSGLYTYTVNPDNVSVKITDYPETAIGAIEIPATIDGRSVTSIGDLAFLDCTALTSITIPDSVTSIGYSAFSGCSSLTSIVVSTSNPNYSSTGPMLLNKNGTELIAVPSASGDFTIPDSVTSIWDSAFSTAYTLEPPIVCGWSEDYNYDPNDKEASEQGYVTAQYRLGVAYGNGYGVPEDDVEAVKWYRKAAEQGHADAQYNLGSAYATGEGVAQDDVMAVKWFRKAAEQRHTEAQSWLGEMYYYGKGVPEDIVWALVWKGLAHKVDIWLFDQGSFPKKMTREQITEAQRLYQEWLEKH